MSSLFCNVALPVPIRTAFTYAVPEALRGVIQPGTRVLVPFRKKSMVGVVVEMTDQAPAMAKLREISKAIEYAPALTPKQIELAQWIANYYLAPIGEVFRSMLPPLTELNVRREIILTPEGRRAAESLGGGEISHGLRAAEAAFLEKANAKKEPGLVRSRSKNGRLFRSFATTSARGLIEIQESLRDTKRKSQTIVAWKGSADKKENHSKKKRRTSARTSRNGARAAANGAILKLGAGFAEPG